MTDLQAKKSRKHNALVHGVFAKDIIAPWESREDFETLHRALQMEFQPRGRSEEECVLDLAYLYWRKQSLWRLWQTTILKDPFTLDILQTNRKSWSGNPQASACGSQWSQDTGRDGRHAIRKNVIAARAIAEEDGGRSKQGGD
jgi:hypothetical protein